MSRTFALAWPASDIGKEEIGRKLMESIYVERVRCKSPKTTAEVTAGSLKLVCLAL